MGSPPTPGVPNEAVVATYDRLATLYDWLVAPLEAGTREPALDALSVAAGDRVLEVGCGPGHALGPLADRAGPDGRVVGLDAARGMLARARRRVDRGGRTGREGTAAGQSTRAPVDLVLGDARSLPVADASVAAVFVEDTLELFDPPDVATVLGEVRRVLAADGRLCVVTMERAGAETDPFVRAYDWSFRHVPGYDRFGCRPVYARRALDENGFEVERRERLRRAHVWPVEVLVATPR